MSIIVDYVHCYYIINLCYLIVNRLKVENRGS